MRTFMDEVWDWVSIFWRLNRAFRCVVSLVNFLCLKKYMHKWVDAAEYCQIIFFSKALVSQHEFVVLCVLIDYILTPKYILLYFDYNYKQLSSFFSFCWAFLTCSEEYHLFVWSVKSVSKFVCFNFLGLCKKNRFQVAAIHMGETSI